MKILLITHHWHTNSHHSKYSGYQNLAFDLAKHHSVTLLTWGNENKTENDHGVDVKIIQTVDNDKLFKRRLKLSKEAASIANQFDIVHALYSDCGFYLPKMKNYLATVHVTPGIARYNNFKQKVFLFLKAIFIERRVFRNANKIIVISSNLYSEMAKKYKDKLIMLPHGIDVNYWKPVPSAENNTLKDSYLKHGDYKKIATCVGFHGVNYTRMDYIVNNNPDVLFIFVGLKRSFTQSNVIEKRGISDEELRNIYEIADVFYRPVDFATANNSILEAMAMGKPIISDRIDGVIDYLDDSTALLAVSDKEHQELFRKAIDNEQIASQLAHNALQAAQRKFSWEVLNARLTSIYSELV